MSWEISYFYVFVHVTMSRMRFSLGDSCELAVFLGLSHRCTVLGLDLDGAVVLHAMSISQTETHGATCTCTCTCESCDVTCAVSGGLSPRPRASRKRNRGVGELGTGLSGARGRRY